nr:hypothetical protein [uncultured Pedobacter sp.]
MQSHLTNWYQLLVNQSKTDHVYDLIHNGLSFDFNPQDPEGFVIIYPPNLPKHLQPLNPNHVVQNPKYIEPRFAMLKNDYLTPYLEAGTEFEVMEQLRYNYAFLNFPLPLKKERQFTEDDEEEDDNQPILSNKQPEQIFEDDDPLLYCYELIKKAENRELALALAQEGQQVLENKIAQINPESQLQELLRICTGFNILAIAYAWNNKMDEAKICDSYYIHNPMFNFMHYVIAPYLEILIVKKQTAYLHTLFANQAFKKSYLPHYEAFISLLENPHYECQKMNEMIPIINRVNNVMQQFI